MEVVVTVVVAIVVAAVMEVVATVVAVIVAVVAVVVVVAITTPFIFLVTTIMSLEVPVMRTPLPAPLQTPPTLSNSTSRVTA